MAKKLNVLLIDDDEDEFILMRDLFEQLSTFSPKVLFSLDWTDSTDQARQAFAKRQYDLYLLDYRLGSMNGLDLLVEVEAKGNQSPVILLTGQGSYEVDLAAMEAGAADYLVKDQLTGPLLERSMRYAMERKQAKHALLAAHQKLSALHHATAALLSTINLEELLEQILDSAQSAIPVAEKGLLHLIAPETGQLQVRAMIGFQNPRIKRFRNPHSLDLPALAVRQRQPILIQDTQASEAVLRQLDDDPDYTDMRSVIVAPLLAATDVLGAISLSASRPMAFSSDDLDLLTSFAAATSAALQNAILHSEVQKLAVTDSLTGQYNRRAFFEMGEREMDRFRRFNHMLSCIMLDVDNFKQINDTYGHHSGDLVLQELSRRCCATIRQVDILGRYGGDEFSILLPVTGIEQALEIAERIRQSVSESGINTSLGIICPSISLGVATATSDMDDIHQLVERADRALYTAKVKGRNNVAGV